MNADRKLTPRQLEALVNVYCGDGWKNRRIYPADGDSAIDGPASERPAWGKVMKHGYITSMGGAAARMRETLEAQGYFPLVQSTGRSDRLYYTNCDLTAKALRALKGKYPGLPDIDRRITERERVERDAKEAAAKEREQQRQRAQERDARAAIEKAERMAAILQDYQVPHSLTQDQLTAIWDRVVNEDGAVC